MVAKHYGGTSLKMFYVYLHRRMDTMYPFYVGKGQGRRAWVKRNRNLHWRNIVAKCGYSVEMVCEFEEETDALHYENHLIAELNALGCELVNYTEGGDGGTGHRHTEATKQAIRAKMLGKQNSLGSIQSKETKEKRAAKLRGIPRTQEVRDKVSAAKKGKSNGREGYKHSQETIAKIRANGTGWKHTPEQIQKMKDAWVRRKAKAEQKA